MFIPVLALLSHTKTDPVLFFSLDGQVAVIAAFEVFDLA